MIKYHPRNERIKRDYFRYQREAKQKSEGTVRGIQKAVDRFESYTGYKDFVTFNREQAIAFKAHMSKQKTVRTGEAMSKATILTTVNHLKEFFGWLTCQPGYKSRLHAPNIEYLNLTEKDVSVAKMVRHKNFPTLDQISRVLATMPTETEVERRDRALVAFAILTGMRDSALASLRLKHVDEHQSPVLVRQEPDQVRTKFSKNIVTYFFPVGDEIRDIALEWVKELRELKCYGPNDPLFPRTRLGHDANQEFVADGFESLCWSTASPVRAIFRAAFENAGLPYFSPHRLRDTLAHLGQSLCRTPEEFKAWSQNLGHESPLTTFTSYGYIDPHRQGQVMSELSRAGGGDDRIDLILKEIEGLKASRSLS